MYHLNLQMHIHVHVSYTVVCAYCQYDSQNKQILNMEANTKCSILTTLNFGHLHVHVHVHTQHVLTDEHMYTYMFMIHKQTSLASPRQLLKEHTPMTDIGESIGVSSLAHRLRYM